MYMINQFLVVGVSVGCQPSFVVVRITLYISIFAILMVSGGKNKRSVTSNPPLHSNSNYSLTPCFVEAKQIHIYHAVARENQLDNVSSSMLLFVPAASVVR